ncbi:MAG: UPF0175 family protein [Verrucomicrobia bacterium]|nr:UPF0175 family protein [Verrucomicrobiota bacterium]
MVIELSDQALEGIELSPELAKLEMALGLYRDEKVSLGKAAQVAGLSVPAFLQEMGRRNIAIHYGMEELNQDLEMLRKLNPA